MKWNNNNNNCTNQMSDSRYFQNFRIIGYCIIIFRVMLLINASLFNLLQIGKIHKISLCMHYLPRSLTKPSPTLVHFLFRPQTHSYRRQAVIWLKSTSEPWFIANSNGATAAAASSPQGFHNISQPSDKWSQSTGSNIFLYLSATLLQTNCTTYSTSLSSCK